MIKFIKIVKERSQESASFLIFLTYVAVLVIGYVLCAPYPSEVQLRESTGKLWVN